MRRNIPDALDIARVLRTGYPVEPYFPPECPCCGDPMDTEYLIDGEWVCRECFEEWLDVQFSSNPDVLAGKLGIEHKETSCEPIYI